MNPILPKDENVQVVQGNTKKIDSPDDLDLDLKEVFNQPPIASSEFRRVFQTSDQMKEKFVQFLKTIFYQLDEKKVLALMANLLENPAKSDEEIYNELLEKINATKKTFSFFSQIRSLFVLKNGMGRQTAQLMKRFNGKQFHNYMEIYDRRYVKTIRKIAKLSLDGNIIAVCNSPKVEMVDRIQAGAILSSYPYKQHVALNDENCQDPFLSPELTHKPISDDVKNDSTDLIACLGGLHHIPVDRVEAFVGSMANKLKPGGVILLRDHNVKDSDGPPNLAKEDIKAIASVVHSFVNAANGVSWEVEKKEVREFKSLEEWTVMMEKHGFQRISSEELILENDPTENAMIAFVKAPNSLDELQQAISYRNDCVRPKQGTRATWIEWGNVRFSKQYAEFIQTHHSYAFDFVGHLRQHWKYFYFFLKESLKDKDVSVINLMFSNDMAMNLFILIATTIQCSISTMTSMPSALIARWKHGNNWRNVVNLSELEKFDAHYEKEYSSYLDHTPFYMFDYIGKIREMWKIVWNSPENVRIKFASTLNAVAATFGFLTKAIVCTPIRYFYTSETHQEPDTVKVLIADPSGELDSVIDQWENEKDQLHDKNKKIEVIYHTAEGYKLVSIPRYRPFTQICGYLSKTHDLNILEIGSQKEISIDILLECSEKPPEVAGAHVVYEMEKLQDAQKKSYITYQVHLSAIKQFQQAVQIENIEYIHE